MLKFMGILKMHNLITNEHVESFQRDGVVLIKGLFADYVDIIRSGIEYNMSNPGPYAAENLKEGEDGTNLTSHWLMPNFYE